MPVHRQENARKALRAARERYEHDAAAAQKVRHAALRKAQEEGLSLRDIGEVVGLHHTRVGQIIRGRIIHEGRSVIDVARQAGHTPTMTLDVYAHVLDEFDFAERVSAEDQIEQARRDVSESCPPATGGDSEGNESLLILTAPSSCR